MTNVNGSDSPKVGICLSGGGIRSAAFSLGAIQALQLRLSLLKGDRPATYLSAVSGGSYTAAAFCLAAGGVLDTPTLRLTSDQESTLNSVLGGDGTADGHPPRSSGDPENPVDLGAAFFMRWMRRLNMRIRRAEAAGHIHDGWVSCAPDDPLMPGTPESNFLRDHARYIAEPNGLLSSMMGFLARIAVNVLFIIASVATLGAVFGVLTGASERRNSTPLQASSSSETRLPQRGSYW